MPPIQPIRATDTDDAKRSKQNAAISRVNELDNTAADISAFSQSANAAARRASTARDEARVLADGFEGAADIVLPARDEAVAARIAAEEARNAADTAANDAATAAASVDAGVAAAAQSASDAEATSQGIQDLVAAGVAATAASAESAEDNATAAAESAATATTKAGEAVTYAAAAAASATTATTKAGEASASAASLASAVQSSNVDVTTGKLMAVGAFGLGAARIVTSSDNLNTIPDGLFGNGGATDTPINNPEASARWAGISASGGSNVGLQIIQGDDEKKLFVRKKGFGGLWSAWYRIFHSGNILAPVSQSSGVPTGGLIERGSNANGEYVKFADGTMICTTLITDVPRASAAGFFKASTYPAAFIAVPVISYALSGAAGDYTLVLREGIGSPLADGTSILWRITILRQAGQPDVPVGASITNIQAIAIGRWF